MQIAKNKKIAAAVTIVIMLASFALAVSAQPQGLGPQGYGYYYGTNTQDNGSVLLPAGVTPDVTVDSRIALSFRPNPVGVGQTVLVNVWNEPPNAVTRFIRGYKVTIEAPDGTTDVRTFDSYQADSTGWFEFIPDQVGEWKLKAELPGAYWPAGNYTMPPGTSRGDADPPYTENYPLSLYERPSSTEWQTLVVQEEMVLSWPAIPLPSDYWTRPIVPENREWWVIAGDYPWYGPAAQGCVDSGVFPADTNTYYNGAYSFTPYVQGPNSCHIVWKRLDNPTSGIVGGDYGYVSATTSGNPPEIIFQGMCYNSITRPYDGTTQAVWTCSDLRTGEVYWERTGVTAPSYIEYSEGTPSVPGAEASVGVSTSLIAISGNRLIKYNPNTGAVTVNVSIPSMTNYYVANGVVLSVQTVNTTGGPGAAGTPTVGIYRLINWTTLGTSSDLTSRIVSNISRPRANLGPYGGGAGTAWDMETGMSFNIRETNFFDLADMGYPYVDITYDNATGYRLGTRIQAYNLVTGEIAWDISVPETEYSGTTTVADHGKIACLMKEGYYMVWDQRTGKLLYRTEQMDYPWDSYAFGAYAQASAYGMFYRFGYGAIYAFDWDTGKIVWRYHAYANPYETPYTDADGNTVYSFNTGATVADGKLYIYNTEHTPTQPITRGWGLHCVNATTGEGIWNITTPGSSRVADGYLTVGCSDGYMYVFGKGKSATTVTAPQTAVPLGTAVLLRGTVLDQSPAQPGTPCVSKDSMKNQMEYLHRNQPIDGIFHNVTMTGVPVAITAIDSNNNVVDIGTATTNPYDGTFSIAWTPEIEGIYKITASFLGDDSYGSSLGGTSLLVGPAPAATATPEPAEAPDNTPIIYTVIVAAIAIILAVAIVGILILRKRA